ncbi:MAG TPA: MopE-related protein [Polyangiales bacterium]
MQRQHASRAPLERTGALLLGACAAWLLVGCGSASKPKPAACDQGAYCRDSDCDTICDAEEGDASVDTDHDGTPDYLDTDSDDDTISDAEEAGDTDLRTPAFDRDLDGIPDYKEASYPLHARQVPVDAGVIAPTGAGASLLPDAALLDGGGSYDKPSGKVAAALCPPSAIVPTLCLATETNLCDGLDNDCNGHVDGSGSCNCQRGEVRKCFLGPPGRRGVGACEDGLQRCVGQELPYWSDCSGGKSPSAEICDGLDNDCNGCADELASCKKPLLACPAPGDVRTPDAKPFSPYELNVTSFYQGTDATAYHWEIVGSPCDRLFGAADPSADSASGKLSYTLKDASSPKAQVDFTLSGAYQVTLKITTPAGVLSCTWTIHVVAPGLRVELCWDKTGPSAQAQGDAVDLDLHLGKQGQTSAWSSAEDCYWDTCRADMTPWTYADTAALSQCTGPGAQNYPAYQVIGFCPNPRLDADNRLDNNSQASYIAENVNLDNPASGDSFRVMVHYNTNVVADAQSPDAGAAPPIATHPLVNVYCDGVLAGSFGGDPQTLGDPDEVSGFDTPGQMWRVVDVSMSVSGCTLAPLSAPAPATGYWLGSWDAAYGN